MNAEFDISDLRRRMQGAIATLKHELGGLRTGRASASLVEPVHVEAYGQTMPLTQLATISVPEPRMLSVQVWDKAMVGAVDKAIRNSNLGLSPTVEGQVLRSGFRNSTSSGARKWRRLRINTPKRRESRSVMSAAMVSTP